MACLAEYATLHAKVEGQLLTLNRLAVEAIRIPSERAFGERQRRRLEGIVLERAVVEALRALATS